MGELTISSLNQTLTSNKIITEKFYIKCYEPKIIFTPLDDNKKVFQYKDGVDCFILNRKYKICNKTKWLLYNNNYSMKIIKDGYNITEIIKLANMSLFLDVENIFKNNKTIEALRCIITFNNDNILYKKETLLHYITSNDVIWNINPIIYIYAYINSSLNICYSNELNICYNDNIKKLNELKERYESYIYLSNVDEVNSDNLNITNIYLKNLKKSFIHKINITKSNDNYFLNINLKTLCYNKENIITSNSLLPFSYSSIEGRYNEEIYLYNHNETLKIFKTDENIFTNYKKEFFVNIAKKYNIIYPKISSVKNKTILFFLNNTKIDIDWNVF